MRKGRPKVSDPRNQQYRLRLSKKEQTQLNDICKYYGITKAEAIRGVITNMHYILKRKGVVNENDDLQM